MSASNKTKKTVKNWHIVTGIFVLIIIGTVFGNPGFISVTYSRHSDNVASSTGDNLNKEKDDLK